MRASSTRLFPLVLMLALAALTFWLEQTVRQEEGQHPALRRHDPDYVVDNLAHTRYNAQGAVESTLSARKMVHYPDDDSTDLVAPRVVQTKPEQPGVKVRAERGALSREGDEIFLYDNVVLTREADGRSPQARMTTSFLHMLRDRSLVRTDRAVKFEEPGRTLTGRGMEYHTDTRELSLAADVKGVMEPAAP